MLKYANTRLKTTELLVNQSEVGIYRHARCYIHHEAPMSWWLEMPTLRSMKFNTSVKMLLEYFQFVHT